MGINGTDGSEVFKLDFIPGVRPYYKVPRQLLALPQRVSANPVEQPLCKNHMLLRRGYRPIHARSCVLFFLVHSEFSSKR